MRSSYYDLKIKEERRQENLIRPRWYVVNHRSNYKLVWDLFIIIIALYNALLVPVKISFPMIERQYEASQKWRRFDDYSEYVFVIDFILGFLTSYLDHHIGVEIKQPSYIAWHYLGGGFLMDFLSPPSAPLVTT